MISSIASAYEAASDHGRTEPHLAWRLAWQRLQEDWTLGQRPTPKDLPSYLADVPPQDQQAAAWDLIAVHLQLSWQAGQGLRLDDYVWSLAAAFPGLANAAALPADLVEDEFIARSTPPYGDQPMLAHYVARFPNRPDVMGALAGRCLGGNRYVKLRVLGTGFLGVVYLAYDRTRQRLVAVKEAPALASANDCSQLLCQEARLTAELDHPGIVPLYDIGQSADRAFYVMAFIEGRTLAEHIRDYHAEQASRKSGENRRLLHELIGYVIQMSDAVAHAHERGILHRDIKPGNVIIGDGGQATIVDWGMARRLSPPAPSAANIAALQMIVGTPQYMAPEQAEGREGPASDIFSLGAVLYEVLAGRPLYDWPAGALPCDWKETVQQAAIAPLIQQARVPPPLKTTLAKSLAKAPSSRPASAAELADELRHYLTGQAKPRSWFSCLFASS
jgi:aminoglycoside phosphotransferase (APT) family kinase protein